MNNPSSSTMTRRGERGQAIVILALGFAVLLGFVGIAADVSLMFVRYANLRRAVDAAAVAAAGQVRKDRSFANINLAARMFVQAYGLDPERVLADTCESAPGDAQLCADASRNEFPRKLVRVTAQEDFQTVFLVMLGFDQITLEASAISETAVLDVVVMLDVSESMLNDTPWGNNTALPASGSTADYDYADIGLTYVYLPPRIDQLSVDRGEPRNPSTEYFPVTTWRYYLGVTGGSPQTQGAVMADSYVINRTYRLGTGTLEPRNACKVRFWPSSVEYGVVTGVHATWDGLQQYYESNTTTWPTVSSNGGNMVQWDGFIPTYNFYGCCNDPGNGRVDLNGNVTNLTNTNGDFLFDDLICQPFKQARDATRQFITRLDLARGDRVAFVTYDRTAFLFDPDGDDGPRTHMIGSETLPATDTRDPSKSLALATLDRYIGVGAEPTFYDWRENTGGWQGFSRGVDANTGNSVAVNFDSDIGLNDYPVWQNCGFGNSMLNGTNAFGRSRYANATLENPVLLPIMHPTLAEHGVATSNAANGFKVAWGAGLVGYSYEYAAGCRNSNLGAGLREANNALVDPETTRQAGAVWVIVLLTDGAVGASDPVLRSGVRPIATQPYLANGVNWGAAGEYGAFGVCPYGNTIDGALPLCVDRQPETRHYCDFDPDDPARQITIGTQDYVFPVDIPSPQCSNANRLAYDPDDYARDWADYIGLLDEDDPNQIKPIMFTIGFGIDYRNGRVGTTPGSCTQNIDDCLGEEMLRYLADVGDNFEIDHDYWQDMADNGAADNSLPAADYGPRGICEGAGTPGDGTYVQFDRLTACGNYYPAPSQEELEQVFDDIASRMFTRIAG